MSSGVYGGDEVGAIVLDIGSRSIRAGYAGDDMPKADIPSMIGVIPDANNKKYLIDTININNPHQNMEITSFLQDGLINNWDMFEKVLDHVYQKCLRTIPENHPLLMSEPVWNTMEKRYRLLEIVFEKYDVPAFYINKNAVLSIFAHGRSTGLVLDSGSIHSSAIPIFDGFVIKQGVCRSALGGDYVTKECEHFFQKENIDLTPRHLIAQKEIVQVGESPIYKLKTSSNILTESFRKHSTQQMLEDFSSSVLHVSDNNYEEELESIESTDPVEFEFPTGFHQKFSSERFKIVEGLFDQSFINIPTYANSTNLIQNIVQSAINKSDVDIQPSLYNNVMLVGGNSLLTGFSDRLNMELLNKVPPSMKLKINPSLANIEKRFSSWIGGSILASLGSFQQLWISKQEYEEHGKICINKCA